jgi:hypothetical protein
MCRPADPDDVDGTGRLAGERIVELNRGFDPGPRRRCHGDQRFDFIRIDLTPCASQIDERIP